MKIKLLPLAVAAAMAAPAVVLADGPKVYGHLKVSYDYYDSKLNATDEFGGRYSSNDDVWELNSHSSRLGVKGSNSINNDLDVFYQAEFGVSVDDGDSAGETFSQRDIFVGLRGSWGAIQAGHFDTPLKKSQGKVDQFNDMKYGDIENVMIVGEFRADDIVQYSTPKIADAVTVNVAFMPGEDPAGGDDGPADSISISAVFEQGNLYGAIAYDDEVAGWDTLRLTGAIALDQLQLGAILQKAELSADNNIDVDGYILSAAFNLDEKNKVRGQFGYSEMEGYGNKFKTSLLGLGYDHLLTKQTRLFANYIWAEGKGDFEVNLVDVRGKIERNGLQLGIEHNF